MRESAGWVPDHRNDVSHEFFVFPVYIKLRFVLYWGLLSVQYLMS